MPESEDKPPTLASLRTRRGKLRSRKKSSSDLPGPDSQSQVELFSAFSETSPPSISGPIANISNAMKWRYVPGRSHVTRFQSPQSQLNAVSGAFALWSQTFASTSRLRIPICGSRARYPTAALSIGTHLFHPQGRQRRNYLLFSSGARPTFCASAPIDGLAVLVRGRVSIYETRGQLQLIAETIEPRGGRFSSTRIRTTQIPIAG